MKKIILLLSSLFFSSSFIAHADCRENWKIKELVQGPQNFQVIKKSYFYKEPNSGSKIKDLFLISGDDFNAYFKYGEYVFGSYLKKDGSTVSGWLNLNTLTKGTGTGKTVKISEGDFTLISANTNIHLNGSYEEFYKEWGACEINKQPEIGISGNFITIGDDVVFKYFDNYWKGFSIRSSNINFKQEGEDFDTYRITTITIISEKYLTSRGVSVGMSLDDIIRVYGEPMIKHTDSVVYNYKNYALIFNLKNNIITDIIMDEQIL